MKLAVVNEKKRNSFNGFNRKRISINNLVVESKINVQISI